MFHRIVAAACSAWVVVGLLASAAAQKPEAVKCIAVASALGSVFAVQKVGLTVFGNEFAEVAVDAWRADDLVVDRMSRLLNKRFDVKRVHVPNGAVAALAAAERKPFTDNEGELRSLVRDLARSQRCDYFVVITKGSSRFGNTNQQVTGLGIVAGSSPIISNVYIHALASIRAYDGTTFELLRHSNLSLGQRTFLATIVGPHREVDKSYWPKSAQAAQDARLRDTVLQLLDQSIAATVPQLFAIN
jgi:hypothetical protein